MSIYKEDPTIADKIRYRKQQAQMDQDRRLDQQQEESLKELKKKPSKEHEQEYWQKKS